MWQTKTKIRYGDKIDKEKEKDVKRRLEEIGRRG